MQGIFLEVAESVILDEGLNTKGLGMAGVGQVGGIVVSLGIVAGGVVVHLSMFCRPDGTTLCCTFQVANYRLAVAVVH